MIGGNVMLRACAGGIGLSLAVISPTASAQDRPATIPTVVAQAIALTFPMFGKPQYFDGRAPTDWPAALIPPNAKVIGGGVLGDAGSFRMQAAVFALSSRANWSETLRALIERAGYTPHASEAAHHEGFVSSDTPPMSEGQYCKGSSMVMFEAMDTMEGALVVAVHLIDGESARQNCAPPPAHPAPGRMPITLPTMTPPPGVMSAGGGSSWSGSGGSTSATLRTTLGADSILFAYTVQLVKGGWKSVGKPAIGDGVAAQRFSFRDGSDDWAAALIVTTVGDRREVRLEFSKIG